jgi:hypothetical protein
VDPARILLAGLARQLTDERLGSARQPFEHRHDVVGGLELVLAIAAGLQLAGRLRAAEHQHRQQRRLGLAELERLGQDVFVLRGPVGRAVDHPGEPAGAQRVERHLDLPVAVGDDGVAAGRLVARGAQRVERHRVRVGDRRLLLDEAPEHPDLLRAQIVVSLLAAVVHGRESGRSGVPTSTVASGDSAVTLRA